MGKFIMLKTKQVGLFRQQKEVRKAVRQYLRSAKSSQRFLFSLNFEVYCDRHGEHALWEEVEFWLSSASYAMSEELRTRLIEKGFTTPFLQWFVPLERILEELDALTASGEIRFKDGAHVLQQIKSHLHAQWFEELPLWAEAFAATRKQALDQGLATPADDSTPDGITTALAPGEEDDPPVDPEALHAWMLEDARRSGDKEWEREIKGFDLGDFRTKYLGSLPALATSSIEDEEELWRRFFPLFKLLDRHLVYLSKEAFVRETKSDEQAYARYQTEMVRRVVAGYQAFVRERDAA